MLVLKHVLSSTKNQDKNIDLHIYSLDLLKQAISLQNLKS